VPPSIINEIISKSKKYQTAMNDSPPMVVNIPMPIPSQESSPMPMGSSAPLNTSVDSDASILRALMYKASA
jgi:hypothetical protein